jgi:nonsense-mediated mRNA decay protein 3
MKRFCPKCGKTIESGVLCSDCQTTELKYEAPLIQVSEFNRYIEKGRWVQFTDIETLIVKKVRESLSRKDVDITIDPFEFIPQPKTKVQITARTTIDGVEIELPVRLSYRQCDFGQKQKTEYYEGILQLRRPSEEVFAYIERELKKIGKKGVFITKTVETKDGVDLYFTKKEAMKILAYKLPNQFGGQISVNPQLFTHNHQTSKDVYRLNILVEFPKFTINSVVSYTKNKNSYLARIMKMGKIIQGKNLLTGKLVSFELKFIDEIEVYDVKESRVVQTMPELLVMDPETYQSEMPTNTDILKGVYEEDNEVLTVRTNQGFFVIE